MTAQGLVVHQPNPHRQQVCANPSVSCMSSHHISRAPSHATAPNGAPSHPVAWCMVDVRGECGEVAAEIVDGACAEVERVADGGGAECLRRRCHHVLTRTDAWVTVAIVQRTQTAAPRTAHRPLLPLGGSVRVCAALSSTCCPLSS